MKPDKNCRRMWFMGNVFYVGNPIDWVAVREPERQLYQTRKLEYFNGSFWVGAQEAEFCETKEAALDRFKLLRKKRLVKLSREMCRLANAEPKWRQKR